MDDLQFELKNIFNKKSTQEDAKIPDDYRNNPNIESNSSFYNFSDLQMHNIRNQQQQANSQANIELLQQLSTSSYIERMKRNPYIRHRYLKNQNDNSIENMDTFITFNTTPSENYKLQFYNYGSNNVKKEYNLRFYPKFYRYNYTQNELKFYPKFSQEIYDKELNQNLKKPSQYKQFHSNWDSLTEKDVINTQEYKGFYANQYDYQLFKMIQLSEIQTRH